MKDKLFAYIDSHREEILRLGDTLFHNPELGYHEFETGRIIREYLKEHGLKVSRETSYTGFTVTIGSGSPHIGVIAELDAIPTLGHPCANPETTAAHACGHSTQCTAALAAFDAVNQQINTLGGTVTLYFTPAEEFTDLEYRKQLRAEGKVNYLSGKQNMITEHVFDDADCIIHLHAMGDSPFRFSIGSVLSGFIYKKITFLGKAAHAAMMPHLGVNALNECNLFLNAVNALRETFRDEDVVRVHGRIMDGGNTVNSIPGRVVYECYVRTVNPDVLQDLNARITNAAHCCAKAIGGEAVIEDIPGYLPLHQNEKLNEVVHENILLHGREEEILYGEMSAAAGDVGDLCMFKPLVQYGYSGFSGRIHGADLKIENPEEVYITQAKILSGIVCDLLADPGKVEAIKESFKPKMTNEEYLDYLNRKDSL